MDEELLKLLSVHYGTTGKVGPQFGNQDLVTIKVRCEFEPFGYATEDWNLVWVVILNTVPQHWRDNQGIWHKYTNDFPMSFKERTLLKAYEQAKAFIKDFTNKGGVI